MYARGQKVEVVNHLCGKSKSGNSAQETRTADPPKSFEVKSKQMIKPKNPEVGVWKTNELKGRKTHKQKPKCGERPATCQSDFNGAKRPNKSKQPKSSPKRRFNGTNRQWNNSSYNSFMPMPMPYGSCFNMPYFHLPWLLHYSYMPSPLYYGSNSCSYKESASIRSPHPNNDCFDQRNRSSRKNKTKVVKQVYHAREL